MIANAFCVVSGVGIGFVAGLFCCARWMGAAMAEALLRQGFSKERIAAILDSMKK